MPFHYSEPKLRVSAASRNVINQKCDHQHNGRPQTNRDDDVEVAEGVDFLAADDCDQGCRPTWRMKGLGGVHERYRSGYGNGSGKPQVRL